MSTFKDRSLSLRGPVRLVESLPAWTRCLRIVAIDSAKLRICERSTLPIASGELAQRILERPLMTQVPTDCNAPSYRS